MSTPCLVCHAPTDAYLCQRDTDRLEKTLAELPAWLSELTTTLTRQSKTSSGGGKPTKKFEQPLPFHGPASELLEQARSGLGSWVRHIAETRGLTARTVHTPADMSRWLLAAIDSIRMDEKAGDLSESMTALSDAIKRAVDNSGRRWAGPCTATVVEREMRLSVVDLDVTVEMGEPIGEPHECGTDMHTRSGAKKITCPACGATYDPVERTRWIIEKNAEHMATAAFIGEALADAGKAKNGKTMAARIRQWAKRGKLFAWRENDLGQPLYRVGDVTDMLAEKDDTRATA